MTNPDTLEAGVKMEATERERWREMVQAHAAAMRMVIDAIEQLFGPVASMESDDASLLRGPEPHHRAEGVVEALQRVAAALPATGAAKPVAWTDKNGLEFLARGYGIDVSAEAGTTGRTIPLFASPSKPSEDMVEAAMRAYVAEPSNDMRDMMRAALTAALSGGVK